MLFGIIDIDTAYVVLLFMMAFAFVMVGVAWAVNEYRQWRGRSNATNSDKP